MIAASTLKWFKKKDENQAAEKSEPYESFLENYRSIKYFEHFYEPLISLGIKELNNNTYLSKLSVSDVNQINVNQIYACVCINIYGFSYRQFFINVNENLYEDSGNEEVLDFPDKNFQILFLLPLVLLMPISILVCTILYLLINRQILKKNKIPETILL